MNKAGWILTLGGGLGIYPLVRYEREQCAEQRFLAEQQYWAQQQLLSQQCFGYQYQAQYPGHFIPVNGEFVPANTAGPFIGGSNPGSYQTDALTNGTSNSQFGTLSDSGYTPSQFDPRYANGQFDARVNGQFGNQTTQYDARFNPGGQPQLDNQNYPIRNQTTAGDWRKYEVQQPQGNAGLPAVTLIDAPANLAQKATQALMDGYQHSGRFNLNAIRAMLAAASNADEENRYSYYGHGVKTNYYKDLKKELSRDIKQASGGAFTFKEVNQPGYPITYAIEDRHRGFYT